MSGVSIELNSPSALRVGELSRLVLQILELWIETVDLAAQKIGG